MLRRTLDSSPDITPTMFDAPTYRACWHIHSLAHRNVHHLLNARLVHFPWQSRDVDAIVGWGRKASGVRALALSQRLGKPCLLAEDGFLRSIGLGQADAALSIVVDDLGIYYDATSPSRLESLVTSAHDQAALQRAHELMKHWRDGRVSKYNHAREPTKPVAKDYVLVVDQTAGDSSIVYGLADSGRFALMLEAALDEQPDAHLILKVHPDVISGHKRGHFDRLSAAQASRISLCADDVHSPGLIEHARAVYAVTSQMGFEALLWRKPVRTFGMPFYAGWGLTEDDLPAPVRRKTSRVLTIEDLAHAALIDYALYIDPETLQRCEVERLVEWMTLQRRMRERFPQAVQAIAFSEWKKPIVKAFLAGTNVDFLGRQEAPARMLKSQVPPGSDISRVVWGLGREDGPCSPADHATLHVEDGFLRSVGLGANWVPPVSWVIDGRGMYYDATAPSELEVLLQMHQFDDALLSRAAALRAAIVAAGITKYNIGIGKWHRPAHASRVILVPGQVESDASIKYGAPGLRRNAELLEAVRGANPDSYIVYKPHPDVLAKKRLGPADESRASDWSNEIAPDVPIHQLLTAVDEVHVLTSLAGFEALLRGKRVVCYGNPFYAGWGLTQDVHPHSRRTRRLVLDQLVAGTLILYPTYISRVTGAFTTPERALYELQHWNELEPPREPRWINALRAMKRLRDRLKRR